MTIRGYAWLARLSDKARAARNGTLFDYIYPCPMDMGVLTRWNVTRPEFERAIVEYPDDEELAAWLDGRVTKEAKEMANRWVLEERASSLQRQDDEEGVMTVAGAR